MLGNNTSVYAWASDITLLHDLPYALQASHTVHHAEMGTSVMLAMHMRLLRSSNTCSILHTVAAKTHHNGPRPYASPHHPHTTHTYLPQVMAASTFAVVTLK
jgi:hypothetical protein